MTRAQCARAALTVLVVIALLASAAQATPNDFPEFDCIKPNVDFWINVYSTYTTSQGIIHDSEDVAVIYEIISLKPYDEPGSRKINRRRTKAAQKKYQRILRQLARQPETRNPAYQRVAALFGKNASPSVFRGAASRIRCQVGQKDRFKAGLIRSGAYIEDIRRIFSSYGLPEDIAYLPHVESSFNINAYSKFGAAGMWQFTRSTGKRFMVVNYVLDERRDPIRAAHAAALLLKDNLEKLGSWPLAITAYNHGARGMLRAQGKHGAYPDIFKSYSGRAFKFASRNFYPEFLAARKIAKNHAHYFGNLALDTPRETRTVKLEGFLSLKDAADHFGITAEQIKTLNPALRPPVFTGQKYIPKNYSLRLPLDCPGLDTKTEASVPVALYQSKQKPSRFYTVQRGDTAGRIARQHRVPLSDLILANNLNRRATIYPRQTLRIPLPGDNSHHPETPQPATADVLLASAPVASGPDSEESLPDPMAEDSGMGHYPKPVLAAVIPIALAHNDGNTDAPSQSRAQKERPSLEVVSADVNFIRLDKSAGRNIGIIRVEVEETLGHVAEWADVPTASIRKLNNLRFGQTLHSDRMLKVPLDRISPELFEERRYEYHKRLQEDFFAVYRIGEMTTYSVRSGDTFWTLCRDTFHIPMWLLKHCNPDIDLDNLRRHQKLQIPAVEKTTPDDPGTGEGEDSGEEAL